MGFSKGKRKTNIEMTISEKKKFEREKANAIQEKKRVEAETSKLKIEQRKVKELFEKELDVVKESIEMFKKEEESQKAKVNLVSLKLKDAKNSLNAIKEDVSKELQESYANLDKADNKNDIVIKSFEKKINKLKKQEVVLLENIDELKEPFKKSKQELLIKEIEVIKKDDLIKEYENKVNDLSESVKILGKKKKIVSKSIVSKSTSLEKVQEDIEINKNKVSEINSDLLIKDKELKKVSKKVNQINAQIITNQKQASYLADWGNQLNIKKKVNHKKDLQLKQRERALRESKA